jgi:hypothetical protein
MHATKRTGVQAAHLLAAVFAGVVTATAAAGGPDAAHVRAATSARAPVVGVATGETVNGMPVYRLPSIAVTAGRKVELARILREEAMAREYAPSKCRLLTGTETRPPIAGPRRAMC